MKTYRITLFLLMIMALSPDVVAKSDPEESLVEVTLFNGEKIDGYLRYDLKTGLKNIFSKSGSVQQYINVADLPKKGATHRYSASEVKEYRFLETSEAYPEGAVIVSEMINSPLPFKPNACVRGFARELFRGENGSILKWDVWETTGGRNSVSRLVPAIGVKLKGAKAAYSILVNGRFSDALLLNYLKKQSPELKDFINQYYDKGKDSKGHRNELKDNPSTFLSVYNEFLQSHEPLADPDENKDLREKELKDKAKQEKAVEDKKAD